MIGELPSTVIASISFIGRSGGLVKKLSGFKKGHHTLPDVAKPVTNAFLGKISERERTAQAEELFQDVRTRLGYKRKDASLALAGGGAVLTTKDFVVEIVYALEPAEPTRYSVTTTLRELTSGKLARREEFAAIFARSFTEISFALKKGARVEAVVDAIEGLDGEGGLGVTYPSDCHECLIRVEGVAAEVRCTGTALEMIFPRAGAPHQLMEEFALVRGAFQVDRALAGLV